MRAGYPPCHEWCELSRELISCPSGHRMKRSTVPRARHPTAKEIAGPVVAGGPHRGIGRPPVAEAVRGCHGAASQNA